MECGWLAGVGEKKSQRCGKSLWTWEENSSWTIQVYTLSRIVCVWAEDYSVIPLFSRSPFFFVEAAKIKDFCFLIASTTICEHDKLRFIPRCCRARVRFSLSNFLIFFSFLSISNFFLSLLLVVVSLHFTAEELLDGKFHFTIPSFLIQRRVKKK